MTGHTSSQLSLALSGLEPQTDVRAQLSATSALGFRAVQLDVTHPQCRPRSLDRSARRDVAAALRRYELLLSGVDLLIPQRHFVEVTHLDRALAAARNAMEFAREIADLVGGDPVVTSRLDLESPPGVLQTLNDAAISEGATFAALVWPVPESTPEGPGFRLAFDPATVIAKGDDPIDALMVAGDAVRSYRLSDWRPEGRVYPGAGNLDLDAYRAIAQTRGDSGTFILDPAGLADQGATIAQFVSRW